jgi:uncharacterized membrane protein YdjX (TVP38/TMEM64 family)
VTFVLFTVVAIMLIAGRLVFGDQVELAVRQWFSGAQREHWGLPATILAFTLAAFVGAPQFVLIAACVLAFGPETGFWWSWIATVASGVVTFLLGKVGGRSVLARYSGATGGRFTRFMRRNGFLASFAIRFVPSAPFIVVNMGMAAAGVRSWSFLAGMALGVLPKTALVAFGFDVIIDFLQGKLAEVGLTILAAGAAIVLWFGLVYVVRQFVQRQEGEDDEDDKDQGEPPKSE